MKITVRRGAERSARSAVPLVAVGCGLVLVLGGCSGSSGTAATAAARPSPRSAYTLMQMNLCLSGLGGCYAKVEYPAVVREAITQVREARPDAVTFNEACSGDVALIAQRTGYHLRFSKVIYNGKPLPCRQPGGRGFFGDAVLSRAAILSAASQPFEAQAAPSGACGCASAHGSALTCALLTLPHMSPLRRPRTSCNAVSSGRSLHAARRPALSSSEAT